jgi:GNAT superfamily N-acetyltransferase
LVSKESSLPITWSNSLDGIDWAELEALYRAAPLGNKNAAGLKVVFTNSRYFCFALEEGRLVGAGRALADGADCSYICDVAVLPSHQGTGVGKEIISKLVALSEGHKKIILYAVPGKEPFYRKFGFRRMLTAMAIFENQTQAIERGYVSES